MQLDRRSMIQEKVYQIVANTCCVDLEEIKPHSQVQADLGAESFDFLELNFKLERTFSIKVATEELWTNYPFNRYDSQMVRSGQLTPQAIGILRDNYPWAAIPDDLQFDNFPQIFTVDWIIGYVEYKLATKETATKNHE